MRRTCTTVAFILASFLAIAILPGSLRAQGEKQFTDFRGRAYTEEDIAKALFPAKPRGIAPQQPPQKVSAALNIFFEFNSATIRPEYYADLDKLGRVLTQPQYAEYRLEIEGHTDSIGSEPYNQHLSERRARSVKGYLVERFAIDPQHLAVRGYGENQPIAANATPEGRDKNRRVEAVNLGQ